MGWIFSLEEPVHWRVGTGMWTATHYAECLVPRQRALQGGVEPRWEARLLLPACIQSQLLNSMALGKP